MEGGGRADRADMQVVTKRQGGIHAVIMGWVQLEGMPVERGDSIGGNRRRKDLKLM